MHSIIALCRHRTQCFHFYLHHEYASARLLGHLIPRASHATFTGLMSPGFPNTATNSRAAMAPLRIASLKACIPTSPMLFEPRWMSVHDPSAPVAIADENAFIPSSPMRFCCSWSRRRKGAEATGLQIMVYLGFVQA